jgi:chromosome segregation ATPase
LEEKLAASYVEVDSKSKAFQSLRLEHDIMKDDLQIAKRDLRLMQDHHELREAALIRKRRDWREIVDDIKLLMTEEGDKHVKVLLCEALQGLELGVLNPDEAAALQSQVISAEGALKVAQAAIAEEKTARLSAELLAADVQTRMVKSRAEADNKSSSDNETPVFAELRSMLEKSTGSLKEAEQRARRAEESLEVLELRGAQNLGSCEDRAVRAESDLASTTQRLMEAERAASTLKEQLVALSRSSSLEAAGDSVELQMKIDGAKRELAELRTSSSHAEEALRGKLDDMRAGLQKAEADAQNSKRQVEVATTDARNEVQRLSAQLGKVKERQDKLKADKKKLEAMTKELHSELKFGMF